MKCLFCQPAPDAVFLEGREILGIWDGYPVSPGHALIIPRVHRATWFALTEAEQRESLRAIRHAREIIDRLHGPAGYNIGINVDEAAGQTVQHAHVHVIPRYPGDTDNPRGGVRGVIPGRADYLAEDHQVRERPVAYGRPVFNLPEEAGLAVDRLSRVFRDTRNSYKFYWFLAILNCIRQGSGPVLTSSELLPKMATLAAYPAVEHRLSLGRQDQLAALLEPYRGAKVAHLESVLREKVDLLDGLRRYVRQRFIRPWFTESVAGLPDAKVDKRIAALSREPDSPAPYSVETGCIHLRSEWHEYFRKHMTILQSFTLWSLSVYLQGCNPNVPAIPSKLVEPARRELTAATERFWRPALGHMAHPRCVYSGADLPLRGFSLDHFLPWSFVAHDRLWNLVPTLHEINSSKGDRLPDLNYMKPLAELQALAYRHSAELGELKLLEDYHDVWPDLTPAEITELPGSEFEQGLRRVLTPLYQIASNSGFPAGWRYHPV